MPVSVILPTRIRVDGRALQESPDAIEQALTAALGRALANSQKRVIEPRGRYLQVIARAPGFTWCGASIDADLRTSVEARIGSIYESLLVQHSIVDPTALQEVPEVLPDDPFEVYDTSRGQALAGIYVLDSYDGGTEVVTFDDSDTDVLYAHGKEVFSVITDLSDPRLADALQFARDEAQRKGEPCGVIFQFQQPDGRNIWQILVSDGTENIDLEAGQLPLGAFAVSAFRRFEFLGANADPPARQVEFTPPPARGSAEVIDVPSGIDGLRTFLRQAKADGHLAWLKQVFQKPPNMTTPQYKRVLSSLVDTLIDNEAKRVFADNPGKAVRVRMGSFETIGWVAKGTEQYVGWTGTVTLEPLTDIVARTETRKQGGPGGAAGGTTRNALPGGKPGGTGLCPQDIRPDDHPADDTETSDDEAPFLGEPELSELGDEGVVLGRMIAALAQRLQIPECKYAGQFCYHVASALVTMAEFTQQMPEPTKGQNNSGAGRGNLGVVEFRPGESSLIGTICDLAAIVPQLAELISYIEAVYAGQTHRCCVHGMWRGQNISWLLRFYEAVVPVIKDAVGALFISACRAMLLQLLAASRDELIKRQMAMPRYARLFERWIVPLITDAADLKVMADTLRDFKAARMGLQIAGGVPIPIANANDWVAASGGLLHALKGNDIVRRAGEAFGIVQDRGMDKIRDRKGVLWSSEDLEQAINLRMEVAAGADPLVKQITDTPEAKKRFATTDSVQHELERLLAEMLQNNAEMQQKTREQPSFAFGASSISEDIRNASITGGKYSLQGIHKIAHEQIGAAFKGSGYYGAGVDALFDSEEGKAALKAFAAITGFVLLCVLVPGGAFLAFAAGGAMAADELDKAYEKKRLYRSLINPDQVLSYAEVEVGIFLAWFGVVMAAIPEAGSAAKGLIAGGKALIKREGAALAETAGKAIASRVAKELAEYAVKDLFAALLKEAVVNVLMDQVIQRAIAPLAQQIQHEAAIGVAGTTDDADAQPLDEEAQEFIDSVRELVAEDLD